LTPVPTVSPSVQILPSAVPTKDPIPERSDVVVAVMGFSPWSSSSTLTDGGVQAHEAVTANQIEEWVLRNVPAVVELDVIVNIGSNQEIVDPARARFLQVTERSLFMQCDITMFYRSTDEENDVKGWVYAAFDDADDKEAYLSNLQRRSDAFQGVEHVVVEVDGYIPPSSDAETLPETNSNVAVIAGAAVGGAALMLLAIFLFMRQGPTKSILDPIQQSIANPETARPPKGAVST
jgi:hypothetical protein